LNMKPPLFPPSFRGAPSRTQTQERKEKTMGLDMYAMVTNEQFDSEVDFKPERTSELHYWRKHPNLHGWMEQL